MSKEFILQVLREALELQVELLVEEDGPRHASIMACTPYDVNTIPTGTTNLASRGAGTYITRATSQQFEVTATGAAS